MKVFPTKLDKITSKKGDEFVLLKGITAEGDTVEAFLSSDQAKEFKITDEHVLSSSQLKEVLGSFEPIEIFYNQRGRVESIKV